MSDLTAAGSGTPALGASSSYRIGPAAASARIDGGYELVSSLPQHEMRPDTYEGSPK
jgi:hypothetical protein